MDWDALIPVTTADLTAAITGLLANPVVGGGLLIILGSVLAPTIVRFIFRIFGRR